MIPNLIATSPRIIMSERIKTKPKKYEIDFEKFSFSVFNSNFII